MLPDGSVIFCDFDGTVTVEETFIGSLTTLVDPKDGAALRSSYERGELKLYQYVEALFATVPSSRYALLDDYAKTVHIRPGFSEFLDCAKQLGVPVVVISAGIRPIQEKLLAPYIDRIAAFHSLELDLSGPYMRFLTDPDPTGEMNDKVRIMDSYRAPFKIGIGDHYSDFSMAAASDLVFARDILADYLKEKGLPFCYYDDFFQVARALRAF